MSWLSDRTGIHIGMGPKRPDPEQMFNDPRIPPEVRQQMIDSFNAGPGAAIDRARTLNKGSMILAGSLIGGQALAGSQPLFGGGGAGAGAGAYDAGQGITLDAGGNVAGSGGLGGLGGWGKFGSGLLDLGKNILGGGNVGKQTYNSNTNVDEATRLRNEEMWKAAQAAGAAGPGAALTGANQFYGGAVGAGNLGLGALSGDAAAAAKLMNPYQQQVIDEQNKAWQHINAQTQNQVNDAATRAGAFGGSRHGVMAGQAQAQNNAAQALQTAGLLQGGFESAMGRAAQLGNFGLAGAQGGSNLGLAGVDNPALWRLQMMKLGYNGPLGQQTSGAQTQVGWKGY